ncbi:MAG: threonyl-tRNA synthetase [Candidatus Dependentiae bacterium]|nr:threonyl-tRNA synthetase [Candidatus Dependentiae bacterium]
MSQQHSVLHSQSSQSSAQYLDNLRHSCAHLAAQAVLEIYPGTLLTIGPTTEHGFFYDFLPEHNFKEEDLPRIEAKMHEIAARAYDVVGGQVSKEKARPLFAHNRFKMEMLEAIPGDTVGVYSQGSFTDLCRGGHVENIKVLKHFKLTGISGSYWRADRNGQPLQRISGIAFATKEDLAAYEKQVADALTYDHRSLGKQLDLFSFRQESPGAAFFHPRGTVIYNELINFSRKLQQDTYQEIKTPLIMHESLWHTSGHYENYKENMYFTQIDEQTHCVRPMNCPSSVMVYQEGLHSYRALPLRLSEYGLVHRYELSGVLHGLFRVRTFTQDDAHIFCTPDQIQQEVAGVLSLAEAIYKKFGFEEISYALSTRPEKSLGDAAQWEQAIKALADAMTHRGIAYKLQEGEGAFYGPKIEIRIKDAMGRQWQCGTVQVDFCLPENFDIDYVSSDQSRQRPVMIHRAIYGSIERFMGILLEHYKGRVPFWIAPEQVRIMTITDAQADYAYTVLAHLKHLGVRATIDTTSDKINAKIKRAQLMQIPWMFVLGDKEREQNTVTLRQLDGSQRFGIALDALGELVRAERE